MPPEASLNDSGLPSLDPPTRLATFGTCYAERDGGRWTRGIRVAAVETQYAPRSPSFFRPLSPKRLRRPVDSHSTDVLAALHRSIHPIRHIPARSPPVPNIGWERNIHRTAPAKLHKLCHIAASSCSHSGARTVAIERRWNCAGSLEASTSEDGAGGRNRTGTGRERPSGF